MCSQARVDSVHEEPTRATYGHPGRKDTSTKFASSSDHTEYEETSHCWDHSEHFQCEKPFQLVGSKKYEWDVAQPIEEEGEHLLSGEAKRFGEMAWNTCEASLKDRVEYVDHERRSHIHRLTHG
jgi:hypothetical protein